MKNYSVTVKKTLVFYGCVEVQATSKEKAKQKVQEMIDNNEIAPWDTDQISWDEESYLQDEDVPLEVVEVYVND